jgi:hypothetical protein
VAPKLARIPCRDDQFIKAYGKDRLAAYVQAKTRPGFLERLAKFQTVPSARTIVHAEAEAFVTFLPADLDQVAGFLGAKRKRTRVLTPEQRERLVTGMAAVRAAKTLVKTGAGEAA